MQIGNEAASPGPDAYMYIYKHIYVHIYIDTFIYMYIYTHIYRYIGTYTHIHVDIDIYIASIYADGSRAYTVADTSRRPCPVTAGAILRTCLGMMARNWRSAAQR